jgi:hypothetical protein
VPRCAQPPPDGVNYILRMLGSIDQANWPLARLMQAVGHAITASAAVYCACHTTSLSEQSSCNLRTGPGAQRCWQERVGTFLPIPHMADGWPSPASGRGRGCPAHAAVSSMNGGEGPDDPPPRNRAADPTCLWPSASAEPIGLPPGVIGLISDVMDSSEEASTTLPVGGGCLRSRNNYR